MPRSCRFLQNEAPRLLEPIPVKDLLCSRPLHCVRRVPWPAHARGEATGSASSLPSGGLQRQAPGGVACRLPRSSGRSYGALRPDPRRPLRGSARWPAMRLQERRPSVVAALAGRWDTGRHAGARAGRRARAASLARRGRGGRRFPLAGGAVRASPVAGQAKACCAPGAPMPLACRWPRAPPPRMGMRGRQASHGWRRSTSARAPAAGHANGSRCWRRITAMTPPPCALACGGSAPSSPTECRVVVRWARLAAGVTAFLAMAMMPMGVHR